MKLASLTEKRIRCPACDGSFLGEIIGFTFRSKFDKAEVVIDLSYGAPFLVKCPVCGHIETFTL